jgi:hypothetical protein
MDQQEEKRRSRLRELFGDSVASSNKVVAKAKASAKFSRRLKAGRSKHPPELRDLYGGDPK